MVTTPDPFIDSLLWLALGASFALGVVFCLHAVKTKNRIWFYHAAISTIVGLIGSYLSQISLSNRADPAILNQMVISLQLFTALSVHTQLSRYSTIISPRMNQITIGYLVSGVVVLALLPLELLAIGAVAKSFSIISIIALVILVRQLFHFIERIDKLQTCLLLVNFLYMLSLLFINVKTLSLICLALAWAIGLAMYFHLTADTMKKEIDALEDDQSEESVDSLNQTLADQNFELQITLRELKEKNYQLEKLNTLDSLAGIHNRRHFDKRLLAELRRSRREISPLALVMFDIDHFKKVNDNHGHLAGDEVIRTVALRASETLQRASDEVFRYGGEEFTLLLPNTDLDGATSLAERVRVAIESQPFATENGALQITASFGVAYTNSQAATSPEELIHQADTALYEAKNNGRNQVKQYFKQEVYHGT